MSAPTGGVRADYGNWVSKRLVYIPGAVGMASLAASFLNLLFLVPAAILLAVSAYFAYARHLFAPEGGDVQRLVREAVLASLDWDGNGRAIDIGCGNGALAIMLAKKWPTAQVTAIDFWGERWEYSKSGLRFVEFFFAIDTYNLRIAFWTTPVLYGNFLPVYREIMETLRLTDRY